MTDKWLLRFTNQHKEKFYLVRFGDVHGAITMVGETSPDPAKALIYDTFAEAMTAMESAVMPPGWDVVAQP